MLYNKALIKLAFCNSCTQWDDILTGCINTIRKIYSQTNRKTAIFECLEDASAHLAQMHHSVLEKTTILRRCLEVTEEDCESVSADPMLGRRLEQLRAAAVLVLGSWST